MRFLFFVVVLLAGSVFGEEAPKFVRELNLTNGTVLLQTCVRHYRAAEGAGPEIYLVAAMHVGESNYYAALQKHLDAQALVMFEGVGWAEAKQKGLDPGQHRRDAAAKQSPTSDLQTQLAAMLGGVFQLDAIDYERTNFVNNDMSASQLKARLKGKDVDGDQFFGMMGFYAVILKPVMALVGYSPSLRATVKLMMMDMLAETGNDVESVTSAVPGMQQVFKVILRDRNDLIFSNLQAELKKKTPPASISLFYGAGHMPELAQRLQREQRYRAVDEQWLTVFSVNPAKENVDLAMANSLRATIRQTLATARTQSAAAKTNSASNPKK